MERMTKLLADKDCYITNNIVGNFESEGYYGDAIEKLAKFENLYDHLIARQSSIPKELETLRNAGKNKTVTFKELLAEKLVNEMMLKLLGRHGLK